MPKRFGKIKTALHAAARELDEIDRLDYRKDKNFIVDRCRLPKIEMIKKYGIGYLNDMGFYNFELHLTPEERAYIGDDLGSGYYVDAEPDYNKASIPHKDML